MSEKAKKVQDFVYSITSSASLSRQNVTRAFELITTAVFSKDDGDVNDGLDALYLLSNALELQTARKDVGR